MDFGLLPDENKKRSNIMFMASILLVQCIVIITTFTHAAKQMNTPQFLTFHIFILNNFFIWFLGFLLKFNLLPFFKFFICFLHEHSSVCSVI